MLHHYLQKGIDPDRVLNLDFSEKIFYQASMEIELEQQLDEKKTHDQMMKQMMGGAK